MGISVCAVACVTFFSCPSDYRLLRQKAITEREPSGAFREWLSSLLFMPFVSFLISFSLVFILLGKPGVHSRIEGGPQVFEMFQKW